MEPIDAGQDGFKFSETATVHVELNASDGFKFDDKLEGYEIRKLPLPSKVNLNEANLKARKYLFQNAGRETTKNRVTIRELVEAVGCSLGTAAKLPCWKVLMEERKKRAKGTAPAVGNLSDKVLITCGQKDAELQRLIGEQGAENEASPLDPAGKPARVRKQL